MGYNGWTNYETWNINLWMSNDYCMCQNVENEIENLKHYVLDEKPELAKPENAEQFMEKLQDYLMDWMIDFVEDEYELLWTNSESSFMFDLLRASLDRIDYAELAHEWVCTYL